MEFPETLPPLTEADRLRYARQISLPEVGDEGQRRLKAAHVLCVGAGGLGSPFALYLAAAGVGTIGLVDFDAVEASNLQRQVLYGGSDVGRPKTEAAARRLTEMNPDVAVVAHETRLQASNALDLLRGWDVVADGTDNFAARYLVNDACVRLGIPNVHASVHRFEGLASVFLPPRGPCYRCLHPEPPPPNLVPSCAEAGVLGVLPGLLGVLQATETLKLILRVGESLVGRMLLVDARSMRFREIAIARDPACAVCGESAAPRELRDESGCDVAAPASVPTISPEELEALRLSPRPPVVLDVRDAHEIAADAIEGSTRIPLRELPSRLAELRSSDPIVVHCQHGVRSAAAAALLLAAGFPAVTSLRGGLAALRRTGIEPVRKERP